ncbi:MAG: Ig-like domain-containing protein [bacterium]|nr:Ig-like domain-containing protein [bacterium]
MKKRLYLLLALGLVVSTAFMAGCGKKETPFAPITDSYQTGAATSAGPKVTGAYDMSNNNIFYPVPADDQINIYFGHDLNGATVDTNSVILQNAANYVRIPRTVSYDVAARKIVIKAASGWVDSLRYLVTVNTNVTDKYGNRLDGNGNGWVDPQDNYRVKFRGATAAGWPGDIAGPQITGIIPGNGTTYFETTDSIRIFIADADSIDSTSISAAQFSLVADNGTVINLVPLMTKLMATWPVNVEVRFKNLGLATGTNYTLTVHTGIKDLKGNTLNGNNDANGYSENETIDRVMVKFRTYEATSSVTPPVVNSIQYTDNNRTMTIKFTKKMNPAYLTSSFIKAYMDWNKTGYILGTIKVLPDSMGAVYSLENAIGYTPYVWVSREVQDMVGLKLDENGNGIGGEIASVTNGWNSDDFWNSATYSAGNWYVLFDDKVESGNIGWSTKSDTTFSLWHRSTRNPSPYGGGVYNWYCGKDADSTYDIGVAVHDTLISPSIDLTGYTNAAYFVFDMWVSTDGAGDPVTILISTDGGAHWTSFGGVSGTGFNYWDSYSINLGGYVNQVVKLAIAFDSDGVGLETEGAYFDNLQILGY